MSRAQLLLRLHSKGTQCIQRFQLLHCRLEQMDAALTYLSINDSPEVSIFIATAAYVLCVVVSVWLHLLFILSALFESFNRTTQLNTGYIKDRKYHMTVSYTRFVYSGHYL